MIRIANRDKKIIPAINETAAITFEGALILYPDNPNFLACHPVADIETHNKRIAISATVFTLSSVLVKISPNPIREVREKKINVYHAHTLTSVFID